MGKLARLVDRNALAAEQPIPYTGMVTEAKPKPSDLDPRPDLEEDHRDWVAVLAKAWQDVDAQGNRPTWGLLHGLRCGGARLEVRQGKRGPHYRLDYEPLLDTWDKDELLREWLEPNRDRIKAALERGLQAKRAVDLQMEQEAARAKRRAAREPEQVSLRF